MKKCNKCGAQLEDQVQYCGLCGSNEFSTVENNESSYGLNGESQNFSSDYNQNGIVNDSIDNGNIVAGVVGAFLFALIGGLIYFVVYQLGVIAGVCGLIMFVLANFGYNLFAKPSNKNTTVSIVVSVIAMAIMIFLAEYFCLSFEIYNVYKGEGITIFDAVRATPEFLAEPEVRDAVVGDLIFAYIFGFLASISNIVKAKKKK